MSDVGTGVDLLRRSLAGTVLVAAAMCGGGVTAAPAAADRCAAIRGATVAQNGSVRVVRSRRLGLIACWRASGRYKRLDGGERWVETVRVTGRYVAYAEFDPEWDSKSAVPYVTLSVLDAGRRRFTLQSAALSEQPAQATGAKVHDIVVVGAGGAAWTATSSTVTGSPVEVYVSGPRGADYRRLDRAADVDAASLAANSRYVYWSRGGVAQRALVAP
jgi:hypothetical protein